jgi:hypothetical protein
MRLLEGFSWIGGKAMACVGRLDRWDSLDWAGGWDWWDSLDWFGGWVG